jgi:hypothetical protein
MEKDDLGNGGGDYSRTDRAGNDQLYGPRAYGPDSMAVGTDKSRRVTMMRLFFIKTQIYLVFSLLIITFATET